MINICSLIDVEAMMMFIYHEAHYQEVSWQEVSW